MVLASISSERRQPWPDRRSRMSTPSPFPSFTRAGGRRWAGPPSSWAATTTTSPALPGVAVNDRPGYPEDPPTASAGRRSLDRGEHHGLAVWRCVCLRSTDCVTRRAGRARGGGERPRWLAAAASGAVGRGMFDEMLGLPIRSLRRFLIFLAFQGSNKIIRPGVQCRICRQEELYF